ncbi:MAG: hypothetical protein ACTHNP_08860 [Solirubrobacterales bacterium]
MLPSAETSTTDRPWSAARSIAWPAEGASDVVRHGVLRLTFDDELSGEVDVLDRMHGPTRLPKPSGQSGAEQRAIDLA